MCPRRSCDPVRAGPDSGEAAPGDVGSSAVGAAGEGDEGGSGSGRSYAQEYVWVQPHP